jgi:hypothetical protein
MAIVYSYVAWDNGWTVDLGDAAIRLGSGISFTELAELGAVGSSSVVIDDPLGTVGHTSDGILAYQQFFVDVDEAIPDRLYAGWTKPRNYHRGADSLREGVARKIEVTLEDANTLAGRRAIYPASEDATVARPSETAAARIAWLLATDYFSGVVDSGFVLPAGGTLDANDYSGQSPADVLNDCCVKTGDNWFVYWDRTAAAWSLAVFNFTTYDGFAGSLRLSNDPALIDSNLRDGVGATNTWAVEDDAVLTKDPSQLATEIIRPFAKGTSIKTSVSTTYPVVTHIAPSTADKTQATADAIAQRMVDDLDDEHHRITCTAQILSANVNEALPGQLIYASFTHLPPYNAMSPFRIARRSPSQIERNDDFWTVGYELVPADPATAIYSFAVLDRDQAVVAGAGPWLVQWDGTGDSPPGGWSAQPLVGNMAYDTTGSVGGRTTGIKTTGAGSVTVRCIASSEFCYGVFDHGGHNVTLSIMKNGVSIGSTTQVDTGSGLHCVTGILSVTVVTTAAINDIFTAQYSVAGGAGSSNSVPHGIPGPNSQYLSVTGTLA